MKEAIEILENLLRLHTEAENTYTKKKLKKALGKIKSQKGLNRRLIKNQTI